MIVVGDVITRARDQHPSFDRTTTPDAVLFRLLEDYAGEIAGRALKVRASAISEPYEIELPLSDFAEGEPLPAYQMLHGGTIHLRDGRQEAFTLIPWEARLRPAPRYSGYVTGGVLYLTGDKSWWQDAERLTIRYAPSPQPLEDLTSKILLPTEARPALIAACANLMASRSSDATVDRGYYLAALQAAEARFLDGLIQRERVAVSIAEDGW